MAVLDFPGAIVPLDKDQQAKLRKYFHPAQLLLVCLNKICPRGPPQKPSDAPSNPNQSHEEKFHTLVNKLAQICDFEPKGDTITAMAIIMHEGNVTYVLASNRRGTGALNNARKGLGEVLGILKANLEAPSKESDEVIGRKLMDRILWWNKVRVRSYLTALSKELQTCMGRCDVSTPEGKSAKAELNDLGKTLPDLNLCGQKTETYIEATVKCIQAIQAKQRSTLQRYIEARVVEDHTMAKDGNWSNLQHSAGRLMSYEYAVQTLVQAHHTWANTDLFRNFAIESIRSSEPYEKNALLHPTPETPEAIINRAPSYGQERLEELKKHAVDLNTKYSLNSHLHSLWISQPINPIVHAEILLHSYLDSTPGGTQPARFFNNLQYIGTSKPICRMCQEYFTSVISTPVKFRSGHPNTYLNWRLPDLYVDGKQKGKKEREQKAREGWCRNLGEMKRRVYAAMVRVLEEKVSEWKKFDSNTYTDRIRNGETGSVGGGAGMEDAGGLVGWFGGLGLGKG